VQGSDGNLYGMTDLGGANNLGTVFRISLSGGYTNLYSFDSLKEGEYPDSGLVQGSDSNFYGTSEYGGNTNYNNGNGCGIVFRVSPSGGYTNLHSFGPPINGEYPGGLVRGADGNFYGTTDYGGAGIYYGFVFRISPSGNYTNLFSFESQINGGREPNSPLVQGSDGNFYGTTDLGGTNNLGIVFQISPSGSYTDLNGFAGSPSDGANPNGGLVQGSDGNFYGTTFAGGAHSNGTVFKLTVPLNPPANQISAIQLSGTDLVLNIPSVAYETYQLQFSGSMNPTNWVNVPGVSVTNSIGALLTLTNFGGAVGPQGFYRFSITP
jgi:uncharacterized repeat protein (TIGR03803 family)